MSQVLGLLLALATVLGVLYVLWRPRWAVLVIIVMFPLEQLLQSYIGYFRANNSHINLIVGFLALFAVLSRMLRGDRIMPGLLNPAMISALLLVGWGWVALLWSPSRALGASMLDEALPYVALFLVCLPLLLEDLYDFRRLAFGIMIMGTAIAGLIILNPRAIWAGGRLFLDLDRTGGLQTNPLALANLGGSMALIAVLIRTERGATYLTLLRTITFLSGLGLAISSGSRGQVIAAAIVCVAFYPLSRRVQNAKQFFLTAGGLAVVGVALLGVFRLFVGSENQERWDLGLAMRDTAGRFEMSWTLVLEWMTSPTHWVHGLGTNAFTTLTPFGETPYCHNVLAEAIAELGLIGFGLLSLLIYLTFRNGVRLWRSHQFDPTMRSLGAILLAQAAYSFLLLLKQGSLIAHPYGLMWWFIMAGIVAQQRQRELTYGADDASEGADENLHAEEFGYDAEDSGGYDYDDYALAP